MLNFSFIWWGQAKECSDFAGLVTGIKMLCFLTDFGLFFTFSNPPIIPLLLSVFVKGSSHWKITYFYMKKLLDLWSFLFCILFVNELLTMPRWLETSGSLKTFNFHSCYNWEYWGKRQSSLEISIFQLHE